LPLQLAQSSIVFNVLMVSMVVLMVSTDKSSISINH